MGNFKKVMAAILAATLCIFSCGCGESVESAIIYYGVHEVPHTIDPQTASTFTELLIVRNLYEGLLREDENGNIVNGVCEEYSKCDNIYTFKISEKACWSDESPITANDFVFAFKRAITPETGCPNAADLFSIKNAYEIYTGKLSNSALGVTAVDNKTLQIELLADDEDFLYTLASATCMPCKQNFFEKTKGNYGMTRETTLTNGSYRLTKWDTESFAMRIKKSATYCGNFVPQNAAVFISKTTESTNLELIKKSAIDICELSTADIPAARKSGINVDSVQNRVLLLKLGNGFSNNMKAALHTSVNINNLEIGESFSPAVGFYPEVIRSESDTTINLFNPKSAINLFNIETKNNDFMQTTLYYCGDSNCETMVKRIAASWQQSLGAYINISLLDSYDAVISKSQKNNYSISAYSIYISSRNRKNYAMKLGCKTLPDAKTQKNILTTANITPIAFYNTVIGYLSNLTNVYVKPSNGSIDFCLIKKSH